MIGVINVVDSLIAREVDCGCYLNAGREVGVASTKAFTSQVIIHDICRSDLTKIAFVCDSSIYQFQIIKRYLHSYYELSTDFTGNAQAANPAYYHSPTMKKNITHEFGYSIIEYLKNN
jgi:glucosamine 6-phosphate synthetase-like amidotransferase/phosphosugar isomerase protein